MEERGCKTGGIVLWPFFEDYSWQKYEKIVQLDKIVHFLRQFRIKSS